MNNFYLFESGTLKRKDKSIVYETKEAEHLIPIEQVDCLFCLGEVTLNKRILELLNQYGIEILFFNYYGYLIGRFSPIHPGTGEIFLHQVRCYESESRRLAVAKAIQEASLHNSLSVLKYYRKNGFDLNDQIHKMESIINQLDKVQTVTELLLHEANAKKVYYSGFDIIFQGSLFQFNHRSLQPPENEVNSMMSFGYHLLYAVVLKELDMSRLYPEIAFIHSDIRKGPSLHYDLADIYKPVLVDRMILRLIRRRQMTPNDFEDRNPGIYMKKESQKKYVQEFDMSFKRIIEYEGKSHSLKSILRGDIHKLTEYLEGKEPILKFYKAKW